MNWLNVILLYLVAFLGVFLQSAFDLFRAWTGAQFDLLPALMIYVGLTAGWISICGMAVAGGLWFDALSFNPLGASILPLFAVGFLVHYYRDLIQRELMYARLMLGFGAGLFVPLGTLLLCKSAGADPLVGWGFLWQLVINACTSAVLVPLLFRLFGSLQRALNYQVLPEPGFRADREIKRGRF
jgi:hypothetical protein